MGTYEDLKAAIQQVIRTNGNNEITGALLQQTLLSIVNSVGANATFAGIATPNTNPGTADQNVFYLATEPGTYANFGGIQIAEGEAVILSNKTGNWTKTTSGFATQQQLTELKLKQIKLVFFASSGNLNSGEYGYNTSDNVIRYNNNGNIIDIPFFDDAIYIYNNQLYVYNGETLVASTQDLKDTQDAHSSQIKQNADYAETAFGVLQSINIIEQGTINTDGSLADSPQRVRTKQYLVAPFSIKCNSDYLIRNYYRYRIENGEIKFDALVQVRATDLSIQDNSYVYRLVFNKSDDTQEIEEEEYNSIIDSYISATDTLKNNIDLNKDNIAILDKKLIKLEFISQYGRFEDGKYGYNTTTQKLRYNNNGNIIDIPFFDGAIYTYDNELYVYNGDTLECVTKYIPRIDLEIGGIETYAPGGNTASTKRARTHGYIKPPFSIKIGAGFLTRVINRYQEIGGEIVYHSTILQRATEYAVDYDDGYLYRIAFQKEDDTIDIYNYELPNLITEYKDSAYIVGLEEDRTKTFQTSTRYIDIYVSKPSNGLPRYYTDIISRYDALVESAPTYVSKRQLGETSQGTPLYEYRFFTGNYNAVGRRGIRDAEIEKKKILLMTGLHGYEPGSVAATLRFCEELVNSCNALSDLKNVDLHVIPCVNPDGFDARTRTNANGVDINRNFNLNWALTGEGTNYYSGAYAASEAETQIVQTWIDENTNAYCCIDFHQSSYNEEISCLGYTVLYDVDGEDELKLIFLQKMRSIANMLISTRGILMDSIIGYTYNEPTTMHGISNGYIASKGIKGGCLEVPENINELGKNSDVTIEVATDVIGNILKSFVK